MNKVIILINTTSDRYDWSINDTIIQHGDLAQLKTSEDDEIIVITPAEDVLLATAKLPKLNRQRLQQALPYALEDQILDDLDKLHFAHGPYQAEAGVYPVAIIKKEIMGHYLAILSKAGIRPTILVPATFAIPFANQDHCWHSITTQELTIIRTGLYSGFTSDNSNLETLLTLKLAEEQAAPPIYRKEVSPQQFIEMAITSIEQHSYINLLQAPYNYPRKLKVSDENRKTWKIVALFLAVWLGLTGLSQLGSLLILSYEHHHLQNIISNNPPAELEAKLRSAMIKNEKNLFLQWLSHLAKSAAPVRIQNLIFLNNQLTLTITAATMENVDKFTAALREEGMHVTQQSATPAGKLIKVVVLVERETA